MYKRLDLGDTRPNQATNEDVPDHCESVNFNAEKPVEETENLEITGTKTRKLSTEYNVFSSEVSLSPTTKN